MSSDCHVVGKVCISHPCNAVNGYKYDDACAEDLAVPDFLGFGVADEEDNRRNEEHDHLDDGCHGNGLHLAFGISEVREQDPGKCRGLRCRGCRRGK